MIDDVIGLVMIQIVSNIGASEDGTLDTIAIIRPISVSIGFAIVLPIVCVFIVRPATIRVMAVLNMIEDQRSTRIAKNQHFIFVIHTLIIIALVSGASYAGTSALFAAYEAGACINWWDNLPLGSRPQKQSSPTSNSESSPGSNAEHSPPEYRAAHEEQRSQVGSPNSMSRLVDASVSTTGTAIYETYFAQPVQCILKPLFFASIGFSVPISRMFHGPIVWRGVAYAMLMVVGKILCGAWLVRFHIDWKSHFLTLVKLLVPERLSMPFGKSRATVKPDSEVNSGKANLEEEQRSQSRLPAAEPMREGEVVAFYKPKLPDRDEGTAGLSEATKAPRSLYPAAILGSAMVARGEIGFLVSSIAAGKGIFNSKAQIDVFLIVTWAIVLCTVIGPISVGVLVRTLRKIETETNDAEGEQAGIWDALGPWGIS